MHCVTPSQVVLQLATALMTLVVGCTSVPVTSPAPAMSGACEVTPPNGSVPPGDPPNPLGYGNGQLWTELWPSGIVVFKVGGPGLVNADGSLAMKFPWVRGTNGPLQITGRRLDGSAPPLRSQVTDGYGDTGFQPATLIFPSTGCWEVVGRAGTGSLTFITTVVRY